MNASTTPVNAVDTKKLSGPAIRTFFRIAEAWRLSTDEQLKLLGELSRATLFNMKKNPNAELYRDTLERISYIVGIYKALQILLPDAAAADAWVRKPNKAPLFGGRAALDRMLSGYVSDLFLVRQYLDGQRGGWV
jgi:hypothetical protein